MDQKAWEVVEKVDSSHDGCELFRIAKQRAGEKSDVVGVSCLKDKRLKENLEGAYGKADEC